MATGDILSLTVVDSVPDVQGRSIPMRGSAVKLVIEGMGARHPINDPLFDPSSLVLNITRPGYDDVTKAPVAGGRPQAIKGTIAVRNGYPVNWTTLSSAANGVPPRSWCSSGANGNFMYYTEAGGTKGATAPTGTTTSNDGGVLWVYYDPTGYSISTTQTNNAGYVNNVVGGNVEVYAAIEEQIHASDTLVSASIGAGAYKSTINAAGGTISQVSSNANAAIASLTNSSTLPYLYTVVTPITLMHGASQGTYDIEYHVGSPWFRNGRQIAFMKAQAFKWDGSASDTPVTVTSQVLSNVAGLTSPANVAVEVMRASVPTSALAAGDCYVEAEFYPWVGDKPFKTKLHGEGRDWAASTAYVGTREVVRNGTNYYYLATAGTSAASGGPTGTGTAIADGTCVWNYFGSAAVSVAHAHTKAISANIQARHHFLNDLGTYKRGFCCVNATGANIGTPQVWTTQAAALAAKGTDSYGSASLALVALRAFHVLAGGGTTHDDPGGGTMLFLAGTHAGFGASLASSPIGSELVYATADPTASAGSVIFATSANKVSHRRWRMKGFSASITSSALIDPVETAAVIGPLTNEQWFEGWTISGVDASSVLTFRSGLTYLRNSTVTGGIVLQTEGSRSHYGDALGSNLAGTTLLKLRNNIGMRIPPGGTPQLGDPGATYLPQRMFSAFGRNVITGSASSTSTTTELLTGASLVPYLGAIFETWNGESVNLSVTAVLRIAADASSADMVGVYMQNGTDVGERTNVGYNDNGQTPLREQFFFANLIGHTRGAAITDYSAHPVTTSPMGAGRFRNYPIVYGVNVKDCLSMTGIGNGPITSTSVQYFGVRGNWGNRSTVSTIPAEYVSDKSRDVGSGLNVGNGDYHPSSTALARTMAVVQGWSYALDGTARPTTAGAIGAFESSTIPASTSGGSITDTLTFTGGSASASIAKSGGALTAALTFTGGTAISGSGAQGSAGTPIIVTVTAGQVSAGGNVVVPGGTFSMTVTTSQGVNLADARLPGMSFLQSVSIAQGGASGTTGVPVAEVIWTIHVPATSSIVIIQE